MESLAIKGEQSISLFSRLMLNGKRDLPIRNSEMGLLILADRGNGTVTPAMAANYFHVSKPMVTAMVRSLEQKGYLEKIPSEKDRRSFVLRPTRAGGLLVKSTYRDYYSSMQLLQQKMGEDRFSSLIALIDQANLILEEDRQNG